MPSKHEIIMLTTNLAKANIKLNKIKLSGGGGGRGGGTGRGNSNRGAERGGGGSNKKTTFYVWMLTKTTDTIKHPTKGYAVKWCKLCGPGHKRGTPKGMYMQAPQVHAKWLLTTKKK
jgi:hypothetical protein